MRYAKSLLAAGAAWTFLCVDCAHTNTTGQTTKNAVVEKFRSKIPLLLADNDIPGLAVAVFDANRILWTEGFGHSDKKKLYKVTPKTWFSIQSTSKTIVATAVMLAADKGLVDLDIPIKQYLPDFSLQSRFDADPLSKMTLRHLLSHTAGFTHEAPIGNNFDAKSTSFPDHVASISKTWLRYPVGQRYSYSNLGIDLAARVLEQVTGQSFDQYVKQELFQPLGIDDSSFDPKTIEKHTGRALGHSKGCANVPWKVPMKAAGGMYTSVLDLAKFVQLHLNSGTYDGRVLVSQKTLGQMYRIPFPIEGQVDGYALGIGVRHRDELLYYTHGGGGFGFLSDMMWYPDPGIGIVLLTNSSDHTLQGKLAHQILDAFRDLRKSGGSTKNVDVKAETTEMDADCALSNKLGTYMGRFDKRRIIRETGDSQYEMCVGEECSAIRCHSQTELEIIEQDGAAEVFKFMSPARGQPLYMVRVRDGETWDFNDGPDDRNGPDRKSWNEFLGKYQVMVWGKPAHTLEVQRKNGYLYLDDFRLSEHAPGLFFDCNGEAIDFRSSQPTVANIPLLKMDQN